MTAVAAVSRRTPVLVIVLVSYLMIVLDISIVIIALPKMHTALGFSATGPWSPSSPPPAPGRSTPATSSRTASRPRSPPER
jgi:hypothetical protein